MKMYRNILLMSNDLTPWGNMGVSQWGVDAWNGLVGTLDFVLFKALLYKVRGSALPRAWHGSIRTYLTVGGHLIVPRGDFTRCTRTVDYPKLAVIFKVIVELVTTETDVAFILLISIRFEVRTALETNKLLVRGHLSSWNEFSTAALLSTDGLVRTVGIEVTVQPTTSSFPRAFVVHAHNM